jgi:class 3 adenylate cyclase/tetratricopeptide (TPR) repeat protein
VTEAISASDRHAALLLDEILDPKTPLSLLLAIWNGRFEDEPRWQHTSPAAYEALARRLLAAGAPLVALEVANGGLESWPTYLPLRQLKGLSLARCGATGQAQQVLEAVWGEIKDYRENNSFVVEEILGALARVHKDNGLAAPNEKERRESWTRARELYSDAYRLTDGYWTGINAATLSMLLGEKSRAESVARLVRDQCLKKLNDPAGANDDRYWLLATLGETALNLRQYEDAEQYYREAGILGRRRPGDLNSTRKQARLLLAHLNRDFAALDDWLPLPRVVVFAGHMLDRVDRPIERFPSRLADAVKATITGWLQRENALVGFSSAACGADILFQEAITELGGEPYVVLPFGSDEFKRDSVAILTPEENEVWADRFHTTIGRAARIVQASSTRLHHGAVSYDFANQLLCGLSMVRAAELETSLVGLAVWDGLPGDGPGGTASAVARWQALGIPVFRVNMSVSAGLVTRLDVDKGPHRTLSDENADVGDTTVMTSRQTICALLFADAEGYSALTDSEIPLFAEHFLGQVAKLVKRYGDAITVRETWGDGLFLAFQSVEHAGNFALELSELINGTDWQSRGFSHPLRIRIALHAGPVHFRLNPITEIPMCSGTHLSRAARLEPKTPPGQVYASEAFASIAALRGTRNFVCRYVKHMPWAKHYGTFPAYLVNRTSG